MRVIFMGTPDFAVPTLNAIVEAGHEVVLVVAQPSRPAGRGNKLKHPPVAVAAHALGLPVSQPRAIKSGRFPERFCSLEADIAVVVAYGRILPDRLLNAPRLGCLNVHASLLPRWRGASPIQAAVLAGDKVTGTCVQQMEPSLDTGPIFKQVPYTMEPDETAGSLHDKLAVLSAQIAVETLQIVETTKPTPQDHEKATFCGKIDKAMGEVKLTETTSAIDRRVRGMTPWPGGWLAWGDGALKLKRVRVVPADELPTDLDVPPGTIVKLRPSLWVSTADGAIELTTVQAPGRKPVAGADFANGLRRKVGDAFSCH